MSRTICLLPLGRIAFVRLLWLAAFLMASRPFLSCWPETVKDREGAVRSDKAKMDKSDRWVYNDVKSGFSEAKKTGKPLMVVLRCVPCLACMGMDTSVLLENPRLSPLLDQFVRVRLINANSLDLQKFQFDYDLSFSVLFFNGDGTLYGRFGSWEHQRNPQDKTTSSFESALRGALDVHRGYPNNRDLLSAKQGKPVKYRTPLDMPGLKGKFRDELNWSGEVVKSCVHCHQIGDSLRLEQRDRGRTFPLSLVYPYPPSETIGMNLEPVYPLRIKNLSVDSPVRNAGLREGDFLLGAEGQSLISAADLSWVLHHFSDAGGKLELFARRGSRTAVVQVDLGPTWRLKSDISRRVGTWPMRAMAFGGIKFIDLSDSQRSALGLRGDKLALKAEHVGQYNKHAAAKRAGWKKGDVLVGVGGHESRLSESELIGLILQKHSPGKKLPAKILRGSKEMNLPLPIQ